MLVWIMRTRVTSVNGTISEGVTSSADENLIIHIVAQVRVKKILFQISITNYAYFVEPLKNECFGFDEKWNYLFVSVCTL